MDRKTGAITVAITAGALMASIWAPVQAASNTTIIQEGPTNVRGGKTADTDALFELKAPAWPGRSECSLDRGAFAPCSFFFETKALSTGRHLLTVNQYDADGKVTTDQWPWNVVAPFIPVEAHAYCWEGFDISTQSGHTWRRGEALYRSYVPGGSQQATWPSIETVWYPPSRNPADPGYPDGKILDNPTDNDILNGAEATYFLDNPTWSNTFVAKVIPTQEGGPVYASVGAGNTKADNTFPAGEGTPFGMDAYVILDPPRVDNVNYLPTWIIQSPGTQPGSVAQTSKATVSRDSGPCLALLPPVAVLDNGDGTLSATFGWANLSPWNIKAPTGTPATGAWQVPNGKGVAKVAGNWITSIGGSTETAPGMPSEFGANSQGTWTYTFTDPLSDSAEPIVWQVGDHGAAINLRRAQVVPRSPSTAAITPFTHVNPGTPQPPPARPISVDTGPNGAQIIPPAVSAANSGGVVKTPTSLRIKHKVSRPKKAKVRPGKKIHFKVVIRNTGSVDAVSPKLCDRIPRGTKFVSAPGREKFKGRRVCWSGTRLAGGAAVKGTMTLRVKKNARPGKRFNKVRAKAANAPVVKTRTKFKVIK